MSRSAWRLAGLFSLAAAAFVPVSAGSSGPTLLQGARLGGPEIVPNQVIVRFEPGTTRAERLDSVRDQNATVSEALALPRTELVELPDGESVDEAIAAFEADPDVTYAEPNYVYEIAGVPNDTNFAQLWGLSQASDKDIDAPEAWDLTTGSKQIVVAVIDTGVAYEHPDLAGNIWTNDDPPGGGDQDANGFVDDTNGWDFVANDRAPLDANEHGTHVAGTIGASGNNALGVTGVNWQVSIMPLRAGNAGGGLPDSAILGAIQYACANGARVVNGSFSGVGFSQAILDAIKSAACANTLFVFAAGNGGVDGVGDDNDALPQYPCSYDTDRILCVAATDQNDARAGFSNYGPTSVDLAAPGVATYSTIPTFANVATDGFEDTPSLFGTRWTGVMGFPAWGRQSPGVSGFALSDSPLGAYAANTDARMFSLGGTDLSGKAGCSLGYSMHLETELEHDYFSIYGSTDAGLYESQAAWSGATLPGFFRFQTDFGAYDGRPSVYLLFRLTSDAGIQGDGALLDDLAFRCLTPAGDYRYLNGTSMASPHVAGAAALLLARNPALTPAQVRTILLATVDKVAGLGVASGGRLNLRSAVAAVDVTAPQTTIDSGPSGPTNDSTPTFAFSSSEAGTFECSVDGGGFALCASPFTVAALGDGVHAFSVRATDLFGNRDASPASASFTVDTAPPQTQIDGGPSGATNDTTPTFVFSSEAGAGFQCRVDAVAFAGCSSPWTPSALTDGAHTFEVRAVDQAGNVDGTPASSAFSVDTAGPPVPAIVSGPSGTVRSTRATFELSDVEAGVAFACRLDGAAFAPCSSPVVFSGLGQGAHTFEVRAADSVGNTSAVASRAWLVDTAAPNARLTGHPAASTKAKKAAFKFSSTEAGSTFKCKLDRGPWTACRSPKIYSGLKPGVHTFQVVATDKAGNADRTPTKTTWTVKK